MTRYGPSVALVALVLLAGCAGTVGIDGGATAGDEREDTNDWTHRNATLLASEERAVAIMNASPSLEDDRDVAALSTAELREIAAGQGADERDERPRTIVIYGSEASGGFGAMAETTGGHDPDDYFEPVTYDHAGEEVELPTRSAAFHETLLATLYFEDASGAEQFRLVDEAGNYSVVGGVLTGEGEVLRGSIGVADEWHEEMEGYEKQLSAARKRGEILYMSASLRTFDANLESNRKTFERVEGATIEGELADGNATVVASVELEVTNTGRTFTYNATADSNPDGSFALTVPYATTAVESETNVRATGAYELRAVEPSETVASTTVDVPESAVLEGESVTAGFETDAGAGTADHDTTEDGDDAGGDRGNESKDRTTDGEE